MRLAATVTRIFGLLALLGTAGGCSSGEARTLLVAWQLVDGRSCVDTAIEKVTIDLEGNSSMTGACSAQPAENQISVGGIKAGARLRARALSPTEAILYRGDLIVPDPVPPAIPMTLYYTGGE